MAGGMGTTGGVVVLSTGVGILIVGTAAAVIYLFQVADAIVNEKRVEYLIDRVIDSQSRPI